MNIIRHTVEICYGVCGVSGRKTEKAESRTLSAFSAYAAYSQIGNKIDFLLKVRADEYIIEHLDMVGVLGVVLYAAQNGIIRAVTLVVFLYEIGESSVCFSQGEAAGPAVGLIPLDGIQIANQSQNQVCVALCHKIPILAEITCKVDGDTVGFGRSLQLQSMPNIQVHVGDHLIYKRRIARIGGLQLEQVSYIAADGGSILPDRLSADIHPIHIFQR